MAFEKSWAAIPATSFTSDGGSEGQVTLASTIGYSVKQEVIIKASTMPDLTGIEVKRVLSGTVLLVGPVGNINLRENLTGYTVALGATIEAPQQERPSIPEKEYKRAEFAEEPIVAKRVILVDELGNYYSSVNPIPIIFDGTISIGDVAIVGNAHPIYDEASAEITVSTFETVYSYTSSSDATRIETLDVTISTPALVQVLLNGVVIKQYWTSPLERNALIKFKEPRQVPNGQVLEVQVKVDRFILTQYESFVSLEGFLEV